MKLINIYNQICRRIEASIGGYLLDSQDNYLIDEFGSYLKSGTTLAYFKRFFYGPSNIVEDEESLPSITVQIGQGNKESLNNNHWIYNQAIQLTIKSALQEGTDNVNDYYISSNNTAATLVGGTDLLEVGKYYKNIGAKIYDTNSGYYFLCNSNHVSAFNNSSQAAIEACGALVDLTNVINVVFKDKNLNNTILEDPEISHNIELIDGYVISTVDINVKTPRFIPGGL
jgi:hypothetical protein